MGYYLTNFGVNLNLNRHTNSLLEDKWNSTKSDKLGEIKIKCKAANWLFNKGCLYLSL